MRLDLNQRVAIVTGASRGLGRAIAEGLAREGVRVAAVGRDDARIAEVVQSIRGTGGEALGIVHDLTSPEAALRIVAEARSLGPPTILVHAASAGVSGNKLGDVEDEELAAVMDVDLLAGVRLARVLLEDMTDARHGRFLFFASVSGVGGGGHAPVHAVAKSGVLGLAKSLAADYGRFGITANVLLLAYANTEGLAERTSEDARARYSLNVPARRVAEPDEVADVAVFLASARAAYVNGAVVPVTGGADLAIEL